MKNLIYLLLVLACTGCDGCSTVHYSNHFSTSYCGKANPEIEKKFEEEVAELRKKPFGSFKIKRTKSGDCQTLMVTREINLPGNEAEAEGEAEAEDAP